MKMLNMSVSVVFVLFLYVHVYMYTKLLRVLTLCGPVDTSPPGFSVHGIPQVNTGGGCHALSRGSS